jgi:hypothetical protein
MRPSRSARERSVVIHLIASLGLHASTDRDPGNICNAVGQLGRVVNAAVVREASGYLAKAVQNLEPDHALDYAIVAFGVLDVKLILEHPAGGEDGLCEAEKDLHSIQIFAMHFITVQLSAADGVFLGEADCALIVCYHDNMVITIGDLKTDINGGRTLLCGVNTRSLLIEMMIVECR